MKLDNRNADEFQNAMCLLADVAEDVMNGLLRQVPRRLR